MKLREPILALAFVWISLGVAGFYLSNSGRYGFRNEPNHYGGGTWEINFGSAALIVLGFISILFAWRKNA